MDKKYIIYENNCDNNPLLLDLWIKYKKSSAYPLIPEEQMSWVFI